jgi:dTMP kinase
VGRRKARERPRRVGGGVGTLRGTVTPAKIRNPGGELISRPDGRAAEPPPHLEDGHLGAYRTLLRNRNYRFWFLSALSSGLGDWIGLVALQTLVVSLSADAGQSRLQLFALGGIMMARLLPSLLIGPVAGVFADRYDRKRLMVFTNMARGGIFLLVAFSGDLVALFTLTFLVECLSLLFMSAKDATLPVIVDKRHLAEANQLNMLVTYGTLPFGAFVGTVMVVLGGFLQRVGWITLEPTQVALLFNALTFVAAAALLSRLHLPAHGRRAAPTEASGFVTELKEGVRFIRDLPVIRSLILGVVGVFFGAGAVVTLGPAFVSTTLLRPETDWFTLMAAVGIGLLCGIGSAPFVTARVRNERAFAVGLILTAASAVYIGILETFAVVLVVGTLLGMFAGFSFVVGYTLLQQHTRDDIRGKTFAAFYVSTRLAMFTSLGLAPFVAGLIGRGTLIIGGSIVTMSGIRITILLAGLCALLSAVVSGRAMWKAGVAESRSVRLLGGRARPRPGTFVVFEGVEGAGKSTQVRKLAEQLTGEGHEVVVTREPGGPPVAEQIRDVLLRPSVEGMDRRTEALLYAAARAEHVARVIRPALEQGKVVICDRYVDSSLVYQGIARALGLDDVAEINRWATEGLAPDAVVLLRLEAEEGLRRVASRNQRTRPPGDDGLGDRMEREDVTFHQDVARGFLQVAKDHGQRCVVVDADGDVETVARQVRAGLHLWLPLEDPHPAAVDEPSGNRAG